MPDQEIELKFEVDAAAARKLEQVLLVRPGAKTAPSPERMVSAYYDTPECALMKAGFGLRVREVDGRRVQTLKSEQEGLSVRGEWETELHGEGLDLEALEDTPAASLIKALNGDLRPVFATRVERTAYPVRQGRTKIEAALDRGQVEVEGRTLDLCELELELKGGPHEGLYALAKRLIEAAPLRLSFVSKAERGYRLLGGQTAGEAIKQARVKLKPGMTTRQAFQAIAASALRQWVGNAGVLTHARRPEALHQMRVALRRLRTAMKLFEPVVADEAHARLTGELKWLAGELDLGRDTDVLIEETFRPAARRLHQQTGMSGLGERLLKARTKAYDRVIEVLAQPRHLNLVLDMAAWIDCGRWADPADPRHGPLGERPIEAMAREGLDKLRRQIKRRGKDLQRLDPERRHKLRIRAKRLRYGLEFFASLYDHDKDRLRAMLEALKGLQDGLGVLNDVEVARGKGQALAEGGGRAAGDSEIEGMQEAYAIGMAVGLRLSGAEPLLARAAKDYDALMDIKPFWR
ncbi:MAG TPA: CHAD domain-containing protein [Caulobacteraceae bacterium]|jgi:inorganic triphosphatase YgiF